MPVKMRNYTVSFTVNVCLTDIAFVEKTVSHILHSLNYPFMERLVAVDTSQPTGGFTSRSRGDTTQLYAILDRLLQKRIIDRIDEIPWDANHQQAIFHKYFHQNEVDARCISGTAVYQYLFALEQCRSDYVLHVDSDMLFHCHPQRSWIDQGVQLMQANSKVVIATPSHPPRAENLSEFIIGKPLQKKPNSLWHVAEGVSSRYFLWDRQRIEEHILPLIQNKPSERLEETLTHTLKTRGYFRYSMNTLDTWVIHPKPHNENFINHLDDLIWGVENGIYPFRRGGRHAWDLSTYNRYIYPWVRKIRRARANRKIL